MGYRPLRVKSAVKSVLLKKNPLRIGKDRKFVDCVYFADEKPQNNSHGEAIA